VVSSLVFEHLLTVSFIPLVKFAGASLPRPHVSPLGEAITSEQVRRLL